MNEKQLRITRHAYKRYQQRVGGVDRRKLHQRSQTALMIGHYRYGEGLIKLCGVWWGCAVYPDAIVLVTCYGRQKADLIAERRR